MLRLEKRPKREKEESQNREPKRREEWHKSLGTNSS